jgi:hypothetical protein
MMDILGWGARMAGRMSQMSPAGLFIAGGAAALAFPSVRHGLRGAAVLATRGVLAVADTARGTAAAMREGMEDLVAEARAAQAADEECTFMDAARNHGRRMAVVTAAGMAAIGEGLRGIVEEAKGNRQAAVMEDEPAPTLATLGTEEVQREPEEPADEPSTPRRKRSRSQEL